MDQPTAKNEICPRREIAAYIDGELSSREEFDLDRHFVGCAVCVSELNHQKELFSALDFALENDEREFELPENFTKVVVANARSRVQGLRCPRERNRAFWVGVSLLLLVIFGLGAETSKTVAAFSVVGEQFFAVFSFLAHFVHDLAIAASVFLRSICLQFVFSSALSLSALGIFFAFTLFVFSKLLRSRRENS